MDGQMIEQFGMRRRFTHCAKVINCADQSCAEQPVPYAVRHYARCQRIGWIDNPVGEFQSTATAGGHLRRWSGVGDLQHTAWNDGAQIIDSTANMNLQIRRLLFFNN